VCRIGALLGVIDAIAREHGRDLRGHLGLLGQIRRSARVLSTIRFLE
jgi:hypothetical protein